MSKCQRTKYLAGGKAAAGGSCVRDAADTQGVSSAFAALAAARDAQIAGLWSQGPAKQESKSSLTQCQQSQTQIVVLEPKKAVQSRTADIDCILNGDYE